MSSRFAHFLRSILILLLPVAFAITPDWTAAYVPPPPAGDVRFTASAATVKEGNTIVVNVERVNGSYGALSATFQIGHNSSWPANERAIFGSDFNKTSPGAYTLSWGDGETGAKSIVFSILNDTITELNEKFRVSLTYVTPPGGLAAPSSCDATIIEFLVPGNYATIQAAINAAGSGAVITVSPNTYFENINFLGKNIVLRSTDPTNPTVVAQTIIDGGDNGSVVAFGGNENSSCKLSGFTIRNGSASGIHGNGAGATIEYNVIEDNYAADGGGGGGLYNCDGLIQYNSIRFNYATYPAYYGGGLYNCDGTIQYNTIEDNYATISGGGIYSCNGTIQNNLIQNNETGIDNGGGISDCNSANSVIQNNLIVNNYGVGYGGGAYNCYLLRNNTIYGNTAWEGGGSRDCQQLVNNIIWNNSSTSGYDDVINSSQIEYNCIGDWDGSGTNNISADPGFIDPANGDFNISPGSLCQDMGLTIPGLLIDYDGTPRPQFYGYDIGAKERINLPPAAPANLTIRDEYDNYFLQWDPNTEPDLAGYRMYRDTNEQFANPAPLNSTPLTQNVLLEPAAPPGTVYYYRVKAVDTWGVESGFSNMVNSDDLGMQVSARDPIQDIASTWYFAGGPVGTVNGFTGGEMFLTLLNQNENGADVDFTIYFTDESKQLIKRSVAPKSRATFKVNDFFKNDEAELDDPTRVQIQNEWVGVKVVSNMSVFAERVVYWDSHNGGTVYGRGGGYVSLGQNEPSANWYFAEGMTEKFNGGIVRDTYLEILNQSTTVKNVRVTFLIENQSPTEINITIDPEKIKSVIASEELLDEIDTGFRGFGVHIEQTSSGEPEIVAERVSKGNDNGFQNIWGQSVAGATAPNADWYFAEGAVHSNFQTYILLSNPNPNPQPGTGPSSLNATINLFTDDGSTIVHPTTIAWQSRKTVNVEVDIPGTTDTRFGIHVHSEGNIIAERVTYWKNAGFNIRSGAHAVMGATALSKRWIFPEGAIGGVKNNFQTYLLISNPSETEDVYCKITFFTADGSGINRLKNVFIPRQERRTVFVNHEHDCGGTRVVPIGEVHDCYENQTVCDPVDITAHPASFAATVEVVGVNSPGVVAERVMYWRPNDNNNYFNCLDVDACDVDDASVYRIDGHANLGIALPPVAPTMLPENRPMAPSHLYATINSVSQISLTWRDRSADENGFKVFRKEGSGVWLEIADLISNTEAYNDDLCAEVNKWYRYRVAAYRIDDGNLVLSNDSNIVSGRMVDAADQDNLYAIPQIIDGSGSEVYPPANVPLGDGLPDNWEQGNIQPDSDANDDGITNLQAYQLELDGPGVPGNPGDPNKVNSITATITILDGVPTAAPPVPATLINDRFWGFGVIELIENMWQPHGQIHGNFNSNADFNDIIKPRVEAMRLPYVRKLIDLGRYILPIPNSSQERDWSFVWEVDSNDDGDYLNDPEDIAFNGLLAVLLMHQGSNPNTAVLLSIWSVPEVVLGLDENGLGKVFPINDNDDQSNHEIERWSECVSDFIKYLRVTQNLTCIRAVGAPNELYYKVDTKTYDFETEVYLFEQNWTSGERPNYQLAAQRFTKAFQRLKIDLGAAFAGTGVLINPNLADPPDRAKFDLSNTNHLYLMGPCGPGFFEYTDQILKEFDPNNFPWGIIDYHNYKNHLTNEDTPIFDLHDHTDPAVWSTAWAGNVMMPGPVINHGNRFYFVNDNHAERMFFDLARDINSASLSLPAFEGKDIPVFVTEFGDTRSKYSNRNWQSAMVNLLQLANLKQDGMTYVNLDWIAIHYMYKSDFARFFEEAGTWYDAEPRYSAAEYTETFRPDRYEPKTQYYALGNIIGHTTADSKVYDTRVDYLINDSINGRSFQNFDAGSSDTVLLVCALRTNPPEGNSAENTIIVLNRTKEHSSNGKAIELNIQFQSDDISLTNIHRYTINPMTFPNQRPLLNALLKRESISKLMPANDGENNGINIWKFGNLIMDEIPAGGMIVYSEVNFETNQNPLSTNTSYDFGNISMIPSTWVTILTGSGLAYYPNPNADNPSSGIPAPDEMPNQILSISPEIDGNNNKHLSINTVGTDTVNREIVRSVNFDHSIMIRPTITGTIPPGKLIRIRMRNNLASDVTARIHYKTDNVDRTPKEFTVFRGDFRDYVIDMSGANDGWSGTLNDLWIEPTRYYKKIDVDLDFIEIY